MWKCIKEAFGSDKLMSMPMPMQLHEPTSELHKRAEELAYASLLNDVSLTMLIHPLLLFLYLGVFL